MTRDEDQLRLTYRNARDTKTQMSGSGLALRAAPVGTDDDDNHPVRRGAPLVYLAEPQRHPGLVKVGSTTDLVQRLADLGARLLWVAPGSLEFENWIHAHLSQWRVARQRDVYYATAVVMTGQPFGLSFDNQARMWLPTQTVRALRLSA